MSAYELRIVKYNEKTKKESCFSLQKIKKAIESDRKLRFTEKFDLHLDKNRDENFEHHAIEFYDYGKWEFLCLYNISTNLLFTYANKYSDDDAKEKIDKIVYELDATLIGEQGEIYELEEY